jgi:hypothetical protein
LQKAPARLSTISSALVDSTLFLGTPILQAATLYGLGTGNVLEQRNTSPSFQNLQAIGALELDIADFSGFDISLSGEAYGAFQNRAASELYTIDLLTGSATLVGTIDGGLQNRDLAVAVPEPQTYAAMAGGTLVAFALWRRRNGPHA